MAEFHEIGSSQFTDVTPTGTEQIQISATQKTTLQKIANLFKAMTAVLTGFTPLGKGAPTISQTSTILQAFQALYQLVGGARTKILGTNGTTVGFVSWTDNLAYGILFDVKQEKIYIRNGWTATNPSNNTDDQWVTAIRAGKAISMGGGSLSDLRISGWSDITKYGDVQDPYIQNGDTLVDALRKLQWMTGNNTVKILGDSSGIGMIRWNGDTQNDLFTAFYLQIETHEIYFLFEANFSGLGDQATEDQIIGYIINEGSAVYIGPTPLINYVSGTNVAMNLRGKDSLWYTGSSNPTLTLLEHTFDSLDPTASFICAYNITPIFKKQNSTSVIHMHQNAADVAPTSGYKVYTILCQVVGRVKHFFINVAPYN